MSKSLNHTLRTIAAVGAAVSLFTGSICFYAGYQFAAKETSEMWQEIKQKDLESSGARQIQAILAVGQCPACQSEAYEIDYSLASDEEHGDCNACGYSQKRRINTQETIILNKGA